MWDALTTIFEAHGPIGIINTQWEFFWTFAQEGENMEEHIRKLCGLQQSLHVMGELILDQDFLKYATDIITEIVVNIHYSSQCQLTNTDIRCPDHADYGGV